MSRLYGPSEPRSRELWLDVAEANQSQVKIHRILSNTHRQASVSAPVPGSTLGWEAGDQPTPPGQCAWLWPKICDLGGAFQGITGGLARVGVPTSASSPGSLGYACPSPCSDKHGPMLVPSPLACSLSGADSLPSPAESGLVL